MATYYAVSTINAADTGWQIESGPHATADEALEAGHAHIGDVKTGYGTDIYRVTRHRNLVALPASHRRIQRILRYNAHFIADNDGA